MAAALTTAALSSGNIASQYDVLCLSKPKAVTHSASPPQVSKVDASQAPLSSSESSAAASPLLTYSDVVDELNSERWSFAPYPRCTRSQLLQVHTFWVMVQRESREEETTTPVRSSSHAQPEDITVNRERSEDDAASAVLSPPPKKVLQDSGSSLFSSSPRFACVVGVVWVRLASGTALPQRQRVSQGENTVTTSNAGLRPLEGYLQVVLTHPDHRRRGLASSLLRACLASETMPANVFASDGEGGQPYRVERWHLHTLTASTSISRAKREARREGCRDAAASGGVDDDAEAIAATLAMYRRLGFAERRYLYGYYAGEKDAVELVKLCR